MAYMVDGIPVRQKTDDTHPDTPDFPQQRSCVKGRSNRQIVLGADRLKYPMKRKHWEPGGGGGDVTLRGRDEWERISWDEALSLIANEFKRIKETYGNLAFASLQLVSNRASGFYTGHLLNAFGGCTTVWGEQTAGGTPVPTNIITSGFGAGVSDRFDLRKAKLIVLWGWNSIYSMGATTTSYLRSGKDAGAKVIYVDPWFAPTAQALADEWVPVRPGTDSALLCAVAYHMIENNLQDQEHLDKYCLGFDADHMPEGEADQENFKDYIMGMSDGIPKTPEWASEICGTAPGMIRDLAEQMAATKPLTMKASCAPARVDNGQQFAQLFYTIGWMTGCVGQEGGGININAHTGSVHGGPNIVALGAAGIYTPPENPLCTQPRGGGTLRSGHYDPDQYYGIAYAEFWEAVLTGKHTDFTRGTFDCNIKCIFKTELCAPLNQFINARRGIEAHRTPGKLDFVVAVELFLTTDAKYADIVLPVTSYWETPGGFTAAPNREAIVVANNIIEPYFEAKPDWWIDIELAKLLGIDPLKVAAEKPHAYFPMTVVNATVKDGAGNEQKLVSVTAEDIAEMDLPTEPQEGIMPIKELYEKGIYQVERSSGDAYSYTALADFIRDPEANPLSTATGKQEIFSRALANYQNNFNTRPLAPIGKYSPCREGYEVSFSDWDNKVKGEYPFQLVTFHQMRQAHSMFFNVKSLNEIFSNNAVINSKDAEALGLKTDDTALISSMHAQALRRVLVTPRVMPGVVMMGQGTWTTIDEETGIDMGANVNYLTGSMLTGAGESPYNSVLLKVEKWTGASLEPDYLQPQRILDI
jgi:anaerobic dimethyl sulfoxide reductase subunit A